MKKYLWAIVAAGFLMVLGIRYGAEAQDSFPAFSTRSLDGKRVTNGIFTEKKLTVLNFWATWCSPCLEEMPDLGRLGRTMPEGSQLIGVLIDGYDDEESLNEAREILEETQADFLQIMPAEAMSPILKTVTAIPTTIFVDSQGRIVGKPLVGSRSEAAYREAVAATLKSLK
ncbi:MAG: TlpA family protein disulfide reductase [Synergistaceae bacterium]|nr:TlpA family protein disulfide reductase [Synergistaceae bacterium]